MRQSHIAIIGAPLDLGQGRRGVDMGPSALRVANLNARVASLGYTSRTWATCRWSRPKLCPKATPAPSTCRKSRPHAGGWPRWWKALGRGSVPLVLGGDHSVAVGTVSGVSQYFRGRTRRRPHLAGCPCRHEHARHSPSGNVHGMPLACILGMGPPELADCWATAPKSLPRNAVIVGLARRGPTGEAARARVRRQGLHHARHRRARPAHGHGRRHRLASDGTAGFHLSLDMDFVDPQDAPGVGTPVRGGVTYREAHLAMEMICDSGRWCRWRWWR